MRTRPRYQPTRRDGTWLEDNPGPCPYCGGPVRIIDSEVVYGRSFGNWLWVCVGYPKCDSYVGCHKGTKMALGRMANRELRQAKSKVHSLLDAMWKRKMDRDNCSRRIARTAAYYWLATQLRIPVDDCHVGMFDLTRCAQAVEVCERYFTPRLPS